MTRLAISLSAVVWSALCASAQAAECHHTNFQIAIGTRSTDAKWRMQKDTACSQYITPQHFANGVANMSLGFGEMRILRRPTHGVAGVETSILSRGFAYRPTPGFVGEDSFAVSVNVIDKRMTMTWDLTINVEVEVVPTP
jgi:hypothetical protein